MKYSQMETKQMKNSLITQSKLYDDLKKKTTRQNGITLNQVVIVEVS